MKDIKIAFPELLPVLSQEEYDGLKADIKKRGVQVAVEIDAETGKILDGVNRVKICNELGIKNFPVIERSFSSEIEAKEHVLKLNMLRRHLSVRAWGEAFKKLLEIKNIERKPGPKGDSLTVGLIAEELGVPRSTAFRRLEYAEILESEPELAEQIDRGELSAKEAVGKVKKKKRKEKQERERNQMARRGNNVKNVGPEFIHGDFRKIADKIEDASVSLIFTDPPYKKTAGPLWKDLGLFAKRVLKPDGVLMAYSGQMHLDEVFSALQPHLSYYWTIAVLYTHGQLRLWKHKVWNSWKPIIIWTKGKPKHEWFRDVLDVGVASTKDLHDWAQPMAQAKILIALFAPAGSLVIDPMCGSGTIPIAAHELARRAVGIESEKKSYLIAKGRVNANPAT